MKHLNLPSQTFSIMVQWLSRNSSFKTTEKLHIIAICRRLEVAGDIISSDDVNPIQGYQQWFLRKFQTTNCEGSGQR